MTMKKKLTTVDPAVGLTSDNRHIPTFATQIGY